MECQVSRLWVIQQYIFDGTKGLHSGVINDYPLPFSDVLRMVLELERQDLGLIRLNLGEFQGLLLLIVLKIIGMHVNILLDPCNLVLEGNLLTLVIVVAIHPSKTIRIVAALDTRITSKLLFLIFIARRAGFPEFACIGSSSIIPTTIC